MNTTPPPLTLEMLAKEKRRTRIVKYVLYTIIGCILLWHYGLKRPLYQQLFGTPFTEEMKISENEIYVDLPSENFRTASITGYDIKFQLLKQYYATGRVIYVDRYTNPLGRFYRDTDDGATRAYDEIVPQDITFVVGEFAKHPKIKGDHEYRAGGLNYNDKYTYSVYRKYRHLYDTHLTNIHTIAASTNIQKALDILKAGDIATLEGYLIYWETRVRSGRIMDFRSAVYAGETHKDYKYGGQSNVGKCKQLLLTRITFDGHTYE